MIYSLFYIILYMSITGSIVWISIILLSRLFKYKLNSILIMLPFVFYALPIKDFSTKLIDRDPTHEFIGGFKVVANIWLIGVIINLLYIIFVGIITHYKIRKMKPCNHLETLELLENCFERLGVTKKIKLYESNLISNVRVYGIIKQCVIISPNILNTLETEKLEMIFLHELCHLKNFDMQTRWFVRLLCCVHWFNPFTWLSYISHELHCEMRCDDNVIAALENFKDNIRKKYGMLVIELLETYVRQKRIPLSAGITSYIGMKMRLEKILQSNNQINKKTTNLVTSVIISIAVLIVIVFSFDYFY